eukprot:12255132-Karenia_brevis.AAC.1
MVVCCVCKAVIPAESIHFLSLRQALCCACNSKTLIVPSRPRFKRGVLDGCKVEKPVDKETSGEEDVIEDFDDEPPRKKTDVKKK